MLSAVIEKFLAEFPAQVGDLSQYTDQFEHFISTNLEPIPVPLVYLACVVMAALLVYNIAKTALRFALFVVLPTIGAAIFLPALFPAFEPAKVVLIAGIGFLGLFLFKS